jgi:neutral ceramidase
MRSAPFKKVLLILLLPICLFSDLLAGVAKKDLTPPIGTPSAGYFGRSPGGMRGTHDPLLAIALVLENGEQSVAFCSVDNLGFPYEMVQEITRRVHKEPGLAKTAVFIGSSHTHSGGGAFLNIPGLGESLAGPYDPKVVEMYIEKTAAAIIEAWKNRTPAKVGIGYGKAANISVFRSEWPKGAAPLSDVALIKIEKKDGTPLAAFFNFPVHPTVLDKENLLFSADFVGFARKNLQASLGDALQPLFFNGAQGDINPSITNKENLFESCEFLGNSLADTVVDIWNSTPTSEILTIEIKKEPYEFVPKPNPQGVSFPVPLYKTEMNLLVLNKTHAFLTIPGELSSVYDARLKKSSESLGFCHTSILGLTNDAHGYIILPEAWNHKTNESYLSFGGENYGDETQMRAIGLLKALAPKQD